MVYIWYMGVTARLNYGHKPRKRVANMQNKPKIVKTRHCGARW